MKGKSAVNIWQYFVEKNYVKKSKFEENWWGIKIKIGIAEIGDLIKSVQVSFIK